MTDRESLALARLGAYIEGQARLDKPDMLAKYVDAEGEAWLHLSDLRVALAALRSTVAVRALCDELPTWEGGTVLDVESALRAALARDGSTEAGT